MSEPIFPRLIYHRVYNISAMGFERLHPFDSRKYGRAMSCLKKQFGRKLWNYVTPPPGEISREELLVFHTAEYLEQLRNPKYVSAALEVPQLAKLPAWLIDHLILRRMRWAAAGTILGAKLALQHRLVFNLSGGYHHASADRGEGFSIYNDIALAILTLRQKQLMGEDERIFYVDCDAHQGNGVCHAFFNDPTVFIYDCFNPRIYPTFDIKARRRVDCAATLPLECNDAAYLERLSHTLPPFLDSLLKHHPVRFAIYNAGTDIYTEDPLGRLDVSAEGVLKRDRFVIDSLLQRNIAVLVLPSGGYTRESYRLIANTIASYLAPSPQ